MIDLKRLRAEPDEFRRGAGEKNIDVDIDRLLEIDESIRSLRHEMEDLRAEQKQIGRAVGPEIGKLKGQLKKTPDGERTEIESRIAELERRPVELKSAIQEREQRIAELDPEWREIWLRVPIPADGDVPKGRSAADNVEISQWCPAWFDTKKSFAENKGFEPRSHVDLVREHRMADFERAVKMAGARHCLLTRDGMRLQQAVLRYGFDTIINEHGFLPVSVPVIVREECMIGTGFFPSGREEAYHIQESARGGGHDIFLTGTGEVSLMGLHADEIVDADALPLQYATVSTCFRREAGAAGKDTAGLYRIHQFDKVEQVVICRADEAESRAWHTRMIGIVESLLRSLELPHRKLQCCTGDLGPKNADMIDIECWMPSRGPEDSNGNPRGEFGETHSASRLYDYQCRRLNLRYRDEKGNNVFCHSLNNTVVATPRILIPIIEMYQNEDGSITIPEVLRPYMNGQTRIGG